MKKGFVYSCVLLFSVLYVSAADKTWTGGAGNLLFSSSANWDPSGAPASGDSLIFANSSSISVVNDIVDNTYSNITVSGSAAVTFQDTGNGFTLSGDVTVSGSGDFNISVPVIIDVDVVFMLSGAHVYTYGALSGNGSITIDGGKNLYTHDAVSVTGGVTNNLGRIYVYDTGFTAPVILNQLKIDNITRVSMSIQSSGVYNLPITINNQDGSTSAIRTLECASGTYVTNTAAITLGPNAYTRWQPNGFMTYAGGIIIQEPAWSGMSIVLNGHNIISGVPIDWPNNVYQDNTDLRLAVASNKYAQLKVYTDTIYTDVPYALDPTATINYGVNYRNTGNLDLNGNDQVINRPVIDYRKTTEPDSFKITSSSGPATLTCMATADTTFYGSLNGELSLIWDPVSDDHSLTITAKVSETSGSLEVKAGTLELAGASSFPNISGLTASGTGTLLVNGAEIPEVPLSISDTAQLSLPSGVELICQNAQVDGTTLTVGVYTASNTIGGRAFITGDGTLTVLTVPLSGTIRTWTGAGADTYFSNTNNWDAPPLFDGSETFLFSSAGSSAIVDDWLSLGVIRFDRDTAFEITAEGENAGLSMGLGNVEVLTPAGGTEVTHTIAAPLQLSYGHDFQIGSNQTLVISSTISGGTPTNSIVKTDIGTLHLTGTNTFESPLIISNGFVKVNNGTALGSPTNTIMIIPSGTGANNWSARGALYFTDMVATNNRPLICHPSIYYIGQIYPKNGTLVLNGKFTFLGDGRIDNQGTLVFRGGFECLNYDPWMQTAAGNVMRFEDQPINLGTKKICIDNGGTFEVCTLSNTWGCVEFSSGTLLCGAENVIPTNSYATFGRSWTQRGFIDLNGFDQQLKYLRYSPYTTSTTNMAVKSFSPAMLTLQGDTYERTFAGYFAGAASLRHRNSGTLAFIYPSSASTTTGDLLIEAGTVAFRQGATWTGSTNITVTAGTLSVESLGGATFGGQNPAVNQTRLNLTSSSIVNLADNVEEYVNAATVDGAYLHPGTYGSTSSTAENKSTLFAGTGILHVMRSDAPGTIIIVR